jgi:hypothetical protein
MARLGARGWAGEKSGLFEHPAGIVISLATRAAIDALACPHRFFEVYEPAVGCQARLVLVSRVRLE